MTDRKTQKIVASTGFKKGVAARAVTVIQSVPLREGARAPQVGTPSTVPSTGGPVSVTKPKS
jgi:hypothetical protein